MSPLSGGGAFTGGHVLVFQDLTEIRRLEFEARRNERLASLGKLAAGLAHELRNPLASMSGAVQILASSRTDDADEQRLGEIVVGETERLNRLVTEFLSFARPSPAEFSALDLAELVAQALDIISHGPKFENVKVARSLARAVVRGDGGQLRQVVWNLLVNAGEAMQGSGALTVTVAPTQDEAVLQVEDTGPGIGNGEFTQIFDPFFTTKSTGTGLGLATVHAVIEAHHGQVRAENRDQGGARFTVCLPLASSSSRDSDPREQTEGTH